MQINLKNKKALVGGSTSGIGKAIAYQLAESGASVTLMS
ncbi:MAG: SDR family NAD(P)-dependent oxidoreductase, partial [Leeuwenhoekiella sp.]